LDQDSLSNKLGQKKDVQLEQLGVLHYKQWLVSLMPESWLVIPSSVSELACCKHAVC
jgi:hypothetical protein